MAEYLSPGVYVEEIDAGPKPIEGVSTSTAGAVGVTAMGPTSGKPELVTSFGEFTRKFGGYLSEPDTAIVNQWALNPTDGGRWWQFPLAVKGFFDNGGQRLYVKRIFSSTALPSSANLGQGIISEITSDAAGGATRLKLRHLIGIGVNRDAAPVTLRVFRGDNGIEIGAGFSVVSYRQGARESEVVLSAGLPAPATPTEPAVSAKRGDFVEVYQRSATPIPAANTTLAVRAKSRGVWGNALRVRVRPMAGATYRLLADPASGNIVRTTVSADAAAGDTAIEVASVAGLANGSHVLIGGNEYVLSNVSPDPTTTLAAVASAGDTKIRVANAAGLTNGDQIEINDHQYTLSNAVPQIAPTVATAANAGDTTINVSSDAGLHNNDIAEIAGQLYTINNVGTVANDIDISPAVPAGAGWPVGVVVRRLASFDIAPAVPAGAGWAIGTDVRKLPRTFDVAPPVPAGNGWPAGTAVQGLRAANNPGASSTIYAWGGASLYHGAIVELDNGTDKEIFTVDPTSSGETVVLSGAPQAAYFEGHSLRVIEAEVGVRYEPQGAPPIEENYQNLRLALDNSLSSLIGHVNTRSALVEINAGAGYSENNLALFPLVTAGGWQLLANGDDSLGNLSPDDFVGTDGGSGQRTGIQALEDIDEISICISPGIWASTVHNALIQHCEILKDRFAILDPQDGLSIEDIRTFREPLDTKYAALYYPWVEVRDPSVRRNVDVAPSGHMAGIYARVDVERGVHKAPANEVIRGITKIAQDVTKREQDLLNPRNINVLRFFPGRGNRVWGARVVTSDSAWKYINVRRLFIFVEESIDEGTQWVVFEPNDEPLWARVRQTISNFLFSVWRTGALQGAKPDEAFFVKCDHSTMSQDDIDNGRLICVIGIAPVKPAEFVIFRIQQKTIETTTG